MKVYYISGPYTSATSYGVTKNIRAAEAAAIKFWQRGDCAVICPHMNSAYLEGAVPYDAFMEADLEFVRRSDVIVMLPDWKRSAGATREHELAQELGKEIVYL